MTEQEEQKGPSKVLVIDDEDEVRKVVGEILKSCGHEVFLAQNGLSGVELAKHNEPDLILLDIKMPDMDGFQVMNLLKKDKNLQDVPILFLTAQNTMKDAIRAVAEGAAGYIEKPFNVERLIENVNRLLGQDNPKLLIRKLQKYAEDEENKNQQDKKT